MMMSGSGASGPRTVWRSFSRFSRDSGWRRLSCFVGDVDPLLARARGTTLRRFGTLSLIAHGEIRKTKRVRLSIDFISPRLTAYAPLLGGQSHTVNDGYSPSAKCCRFDCLEQLPITARQIRSRCGSGSRHRCYLCGIAFTAQRDHGHAGRPRHCAHPLCGCRRPSAQS